jgi:hypothetical protein
MIPAPDKEKLKHHTFIALRRAMRLDVRDHDRRAAANELARLRSAGVLYWRSRKLVWILMPEHAPAMLTLAQGRLFHP